MRSSFGIVALLLLRPLMVEAQSAVWHVDVGGTVLAEAWDYNETKESLAGIKVGADRRVWKAMTVRTEGMLLHVKQVGVDAWARGVTIGTRGRWPHAWACPFVDFAVGVSHATSQVPLRGTKLNYLMLAGAGVGIPTRGPISLELAARWLHLSNNGLAGRHRNPDIQSVGVVAAVGWTY